MTRLVAPLIALVAAVWVVLLAAAPYLPGPLSAILYIFGSEICHQISERSFHVAGSQLPVCARCFGIYAGGAIAAVVSVVGSPLAGRQAGREAPPYAVRDERALLVAAFVPTLVTIVLEWTGIHSSNLARALAGALLGAAGALIAMAAARAPALHYGACARTPHHELNPPAPPI